jgi:GTPase SAR1 family protein
MQEIDKVIKHEINPFDLVNTKVGNFWTGTEDTSFLVESIHKNEITEIEETLNLVAMDNRSRSVLLVGDQGCGKSYFLSRLKRKFNSKAFFAYIGPWPANDHMWRHVLRYTVDSLIKVPDGQQESQLMLWLKSLSAFTKQNKSIWQLLVSDRQKFINHLKKSYEQEGIYNPDIFFRILYALTQPNLYSQAYEWLKGDEISEESMQALGVKSFIDSEDAAKNILANFGKISTATKPIVLCFDQVETLPDFKLNPQPIFNINTTIHNDNLKNFLIIISIITDYWRQASQIVLQSDKARIERIVTLKRINLEQAESLWVQRLRPLHAKATPKPDSPIYPLTRQLLEENYPGGKTVPRDVLILGREKYQQYKESLIVGSTTPIHEKIQAAFKLLWQEEYKKIESRISNISLLPAPELIQMLQRALEALKIESIKPRLISGKYSPYSLSYQDPRNQERIGVVWTEDASMTSFYHIMNACQKVIQENLCQHLYLIRINSTGTPKLKGHQIYKKIFTGISHIHIRPSLASVHYLATYNSLVNSALSEELVLGEVGKTIHLPELKSLIFNLGILNECSLLQDLNIIPKKEPIDGLREVKEFILNFMTVQLYMGLSNLNSHCQQKFPNVNQASIERLIQELCQEKKLEIVNPKAKIEEQLICLIPSNK